MRRCTPLVVLLALGASGRASGEKVPIRPQFQVSGSVKYSYPGYGALQPHNEGRRGADIATSGGGSDFVVVWEDLYTYRGGSGYSNPGIWVRRVDNLGRLPGREFRVSSRSSYAFGSSAIASDPMGDFMVVWDDYATSSLGDADYTGIVARRYGQTGAAKGNPFQVNTYTTDYQLNPKVAADGAGNFVVVWSRDYYYTIAARRFDAAGAPLGDEFQVNTDTGPSPGGNNNEVGPEDIEVAADAAGNFVVVWRARTGADTDVRGRFFDAAGTPRGADFVVNTYTTGSQTYPEVVPDNAGHFIVAWRTDYDTHIRARRFDGSGAPLGGEFQVNASPAGEFVFSAPRIAADAAGNFVVTWDNGYYDQVVAREFDSTGAPVADQFQVNEASGYTYAASYPTVGVNRRGRVHGRVERIFLFARHRRPVEGRRAASWRGAGPMQRDAPGGLPWAHPRRPGSLPLPDRLHGKAEPARVEVGAR